MKTPITAAQLLLERDEPNVVNRVRQEVIQIDNYTSLALSYLKLLNETSDISVTKISINNIIRPIIMKYSIQFIDQKTKIHYEPCHHEVLTDVRWTSLMIEQLINNALKYARGKDIWIEFDEQSNQLHVKDNGIGILVKRTCLKYLIRAIQVIMASAKVTQVGLIILSKTNFNTHKPSCFSRI